MPLPREGLDPDTEVARFEALKPRLAGLWDAIFPGDEEHYTSVVVPSLPFDPDDPRGNGGATYDEERLLFLLIRLRNPRAYLVYVTSHPIHPLVLEYYLQLLAGVTASHALARLTLLCVHDGSPRPLTEKILARPRLVRRIRRAIRDPSRAYLSAFNATPLERRLAVLLDIPLNGLDPRLSGLGTKSSGRRIFREAGVPCPLGMEDLRTEREVQDALVELRRHRPGLRRAVLKLDDGLSGKGNAVFTYPEGGGREAIARALDGLAFSAGPARRGPFFEKYARTGGIVEELLEGDEVVSPSAQLRINPKGQVIPVATHDQILGGACGQTFRGCRFPAGEGYRAAVQEAGLRVGAVLAAKGVVSRFSVDFVARRCGPEAWDVAALEINLRMGGTTHPFLALRFLTGGELERGTGLFRSTLGRAKYYRSSDDLASEAYMGLLPEDLIDIMTENHLHYSHATETGVLFHSMGALSQFGRVGLTAIGNSREDAEGLYERTVAILDREAVAPGALP